jgi:hypothetical protein
MAKKTEAKRPPRPAKPDPDKAAALACARLKDDLLSRGYVVEVRAIPLETEWQCRIQRKYAFDHNAKFVTCCDTELDAITKAMNQLGETSNAK